MVYVHAREGLACHAQVCVTCSHASPCSGGAHAASRGLLSHSHAYLLHVTAVNTPYMFSVLISCLKSRRVCLFCVCRLAEMWSRLPTLGGLLCGRRYKTIQAQIAELDAFAMVRSVTAVIISFHVLPSLCCGQCHCCDHFVSRAAFAVLWAVSLL